MLYAEDLAVGQRFELGSYTISEDEIVSFAKQYDPVSIHTDKEPAGKGPFGGLIASGFNTLAVYQRLIVEAVWTQELELWAAPSKFALPFRYDQERALPDTHKSRASPSGQSAGTAS
jgi:acyl dehydratase